MEFVFLNTGKKVINIPKRQPQTKFIFLDSSLKNMILLQIHNGAFFISYVMLCYVMLCYVMLCYVMLCYVMLCYVMLCYVMLCYVLTKAHCGILCNEAFI